MTGSRAKPETVWRYVLEPTADGVRITESFELVKPLSALSRLVTRMTTGVPDRHADLEENVRLSVANLKRMAES